MTSASPASASPPATSAERSTGLLGFLEFDLAGLVRIDGVALRRTRDNRVVLAFPKRRDRQGVQHELVRPVDDATRNAITRAVIAAIDVQGESPP